MTEASNSKLFDAIASSDIEQTLQQLIATEFTLIRVSDEDEDDDENFGALTADVDDFDVLVAFTSEQSASEFVSKMADELFDEGDEIDGFIVDGETLLEYLPDDFGVLLDPENDASAVLPPDMMAKVLAAKD